MIAQWTPAQWLALHQHFGQPVDMDILHAVIEGAGLIEPSDWGRAAQHLAPWIHITSMFTNVSTYPAKDVAVFLGQVRRYVPHDEMERLTLGTLVHTLSQSFEHKGASMQHWNALLQMVGAATMPPNELDSVGEWSI